MQNDRPLIFPGERGKYNIIYADPPWDYKDQRNQAKVGAARSAYNTMSLTEICEVPVPYIAAERSVLCLWATWPKLPEALEVMRAWGFEYRTALFVWIKLNPKFTDSQHVSIPRYEIYSGLGYYTKSGSEVMLFGRKGKPLTRKRLDIRQVIAHPRGKHSEKPAIFRDKIVELFGNLTRIELFARTETPGWQTWGDQI